MQTPDQSRETQKKQQNWKVVAGVAAVAALGISGLAVASPDRAQQGTPPAIELDDQRSRAELGTPAGPQGDWEVVGSPSFTPDLDDSLDSLDSPLATADLDSPGADDSPDRQSSSVADDSPDVDDSPDAPVSSSSDESEDDSPVDSPDDSPVDSPDDSADDSDDSADDSDD